MAHKLGGEFQISHGRANSILLPHVIKYNASKPSKFTAFPKYEYYVADEKYAEIAKYLRLPCDTAKEGVECLIKNVIDLMKILNIPLSISECGIPEEHFMQAVDELADKAFEDQCTTANPRMPLVSELKEIYI